MKTKTNPRANGGQENNAETYYHNDSTVASSRQDLTIIRVKKNRNYTVISNEVARRNDISLRAKGLFYYLMTLPDDWKIYKSEICKHSTEGRDATNKAFRELEAAGYIEQKAHRIEGGKLRGWDYTVVESTDLLKNRQSVKPSIGESVTTKYLSKLNTKTSTKDSPKSDDDSLPTVGEGRVARESDGIGEEDVATSPPLPVQDNTPAASEVDVQLDRLKRLIPGLSPNAFRAGLATIAETADGVGFKNVVDITVALATMPDVRNPAGYAAKLIQTSEGLIETYRRLIDLPQIKDALKRQESVDTADYFKTLRRAIVLSRQPEERIRAL